MQIGNIEVQKVEWFNTARGNIGIIIGKDTITKEQKFYMGIGKGVDADEDVKYIVEYGNKLNFNRMRHIFR